jgi:hypothetical protein
MKQLDLLPPSCLKPAILKREVAALRAQIEWAEDDLLTIEYNLEVVEMHRRASDEGRIDADWWDGAMRFGIWHCEVGACYRDGSYPIKVYRWIRHILFDLHAQRRDVTAALKDLEDSYLKLTDTHFLLDTKTTSC